MESIISVTGSLETIKFFFCNKLRPAQNWKVIVSEDREEGAFHLKISIDFFSYLKNIVDKIENYRDEKKIPSKLTSSD